jgi:hypothetical protein
MVAFLFSPEVLMSAQTVQEEDLPQEEEEIDPALIENVAIWLAWSDKASRSTTESFDAGARRYWNEHADVRNKSSWRNLAKGLLSGVPSARMPANGRQGMAMLRDRFGRMQMHKTERVKGEET